MPTEVRAQALNMLVEGSSMSSVARVLGIDYTTVLKLLEDAGEACIAFHDEAVRNVHARYVQVDEMVSFCYAKPQNADAATAVIDRAGNVWTWTTIDTDTKLVMSWLAGGRSGEYATQLMRDLRSRVVGPHPTVLRRMAGLSGSDRSSFRQRC